MFDPVGAGSGELPVPREELVKRGVTKRPDLVAYKYGLRRAQPISSWPRQTPTLMPISFINLIHFRTIHTLGCRAAIRGRWVRRLTVPLYNRNSVAMSPAPRSTSLRPNSRSRAPSE